MLYFGFVLIALSAGIFVYDKTSLFKRTAEEYTATLALLVYLKGALLGERKTPAEIFSAFAQKSDGARIAWLLSLPDGTRVNSFLREREIMRSESLLIKEDKSVLSEFFFELGKADAEEERARIDRVIAFFEKRKSQICEEMEKNARSAWILYATAALGALILIV